MRQLEKSGPASQRVRTPPGQRVPRSLSPKEMYGGSAGLIPRGQPIWALFAIYETGLEEYGWLFMEIGRAGGWPCSGRRINMQ